MGVCICSPYTRETYRYTPLLAVLLIPNEWLHPSFGKYLFASCDILNGILIYKLLIFVVLPSVRRLQSTKSPSPDDKPSVQSERITSLATLYTSLHLLNPLVFTISTRGSSESVLTSFVLLTLYYALQDRWDAAAILLGLSTHWKLFPVIYGAGCLGVIGRNRRRHLNGGLREWAMTLVNCNTVRFGVLSAGAFVALGLACYLMWVADYNVYCSYISIHTTLQMGLPISIRILSIPHPPTRSPA